MNGEEEPIGDVGHDLLFAYAAAISLFHIWANTVGALPTLWLNALHLGLMGSLGCWLVAANCGTGQRWFWWVCGIGFLIGGCYLPLAEAALRQRAEVMTGIDVGVAALVTGAVLVLCQRRCGRAAPILAILAFGYVVFLGRYLDGVFHFRGLGIPRVFYRYYFTDEGLFGMPTTIAATYVYLFLLFSAFLLRSGAGEVIGRMAGVIARRVPGGAGYASVIASGLTGTISGSAIANTVATGVVTIPLMKRSGFTPTQAGAIETAASTGGQLMPPVMGAGAFLMAQYSGIPYGEIIVVAAIPAVLYYAGVGFFVFFLCRGGDITTVAAESQKASADTVKARTLWLPIAAVTALLVAGLTPVFAAFGGIVTIVALSWLSSERRMGLRAIGEALAQGAHWMVTTSLLLACTGIVVGTLSMTGLSSAISHLVLTWSGGYLPMALLLLALLSLVAGMGLPVTAAYIVVAVVAVPALQDLGVSLLAAHFIVFWLSQDSNVTPPVCLAAFTAASIAGSPPMRTGLMAWRAAKALYIVVVLFAYTHILDGTWSERLWVGAFALAGLFALNAAAAPGGRRVVPYGRRLMWALIAVALFVPMPLLNVCGALALVLLALAVRRLDKAHR